MNKISDELELKRKAILQAKAILEPFGDFFIVVEGASACGYTHDGIIKDLREMLIKFEKSIGDDPNHDWSKK